MSAKAGNMEWNFRDQHLVMLPQRALYWKDRGILIISDLHIGKAGHFRKAGIAVPRKLEQEDLANLSDLIQAIHPSTLIFLGDLFHSEYNNDWHWLGMWRESFRQIKMLLIKGNHDILADKYYRDADIEVVNDFTTGPFTFVHEPKRLTEVVRGEGKYLISGHLHPAVRLKGKGRQSVTLSCFYFGPEQGVLPAFGRFTGRCCIREEEGSVTFGIVNDKVIRLSGSVGGMS